MDFFEAQDQARSRTKLLILYFALAVIMIVCAVYLAVTAGVFYYYYEMGEEPPVFFSAQRMELTALFVVPLIGLGSFWKITQLGRSGGAGVAVALGGRRVEHSTKRPEERKLLNVVEEMAIASGTPVPAVYIMDGEVGINAFAAGLGLEDAAIGVTRGAVEQLDRDELQGVIAHEFSHILNGDMRLSTKLSGWIFGIVMLTLLGRGFWALIKGGSGSGSRTSGRGIYVGTPRARGSSRGGDSKGGAGALIIAVILVAVLITIIGFIGEFFARLIQAAVSRQREYLADAAAVQFTRNPEGIGNALRRIGGAPQYSRVEHPGAGQFAHAFFSKSLRGEVSFLATHPPLGDRIGRVLPNWQGDYLPPRPKAKPKPKKEAKREQKGFFDFSGKGDGHLQQALGAGILMKLLGQMPEQGKGFAEATRLKLENLLPEAFDDVAQSPAVVLALLLHDGDAAVEQRGYLDEHYPEIAEATLAFQSNLQALDRAQRLVLVELMGARLPETLLTDTEKEDFLSAIRFLAQADKEITSFEVACMQVVQRRLFAAHPAVSARPAILEAASVLATRLARETRVDGLQTETLLKQASGYSSYFINQLTPTETVDFASLEKAFADLARSPLGVRRQFLQICERIVAADQKATMEEVELLRALAIGLGIPAAPVFTALE